MKQRPLAISLIGLLIGVNLLLAGCTPRRGEATPTSSMEQIQTRAVASFAANLTSTALAMPTGTPTPTETPTATATGTSPVTDMTAPAPTRTGAIPTTSCYGLTFVSDVSVPDNTNMTPGQKFTKTWRVRNSGSCVWEEGFKFTFTGGEAMGGTSVTLDSAVQPGKEADLSVGLTAPNAAGTYRGNWRMTTSSGAYFGDEVYVLIVVSGPTVTATLKPSATQTLAPTESPTPTETPTETEAPS